jgi:flavin-dependent dehydrogenase
MKEELVDVLIIGAGPSGTVAASILKKYKYNVKIVEKQKFPRFVIGESLLPKCMEALEEAGFIEALNQRGYQQKFGAKFVWGNKICDFNFFENFTKGWNWTWQVPRADFDNTLVCEVMKMGVSVEFQREVTEIVFDGKNSCTTIKGDNGELSKIRARFIVDASGYGRIIPRLFNLDKPSGLKPRKTLFSHLKDNKRFSYGEPNRITIVIHDQEIWIWVIPFSNGITSVGIVADKDFFEKYAGDASQKLKKIISEIPEIKERFGDQEFLFDAKTIENWSVKTDKFYGDGFVLTGNVTEFLDPVFSSGVTLATVTGQRAAHLVARFLNGEVIDWEREYMVPTMQGVDVFRSYVMAWYDGSLQKIFFSPNQDPDIKRKICSVLSGYVWDESNPYVLHHSENIKRLARLIDLESRLSENIK